MPWWGGIQNGQDCQDVYNFCFFKIVKSYIPCKLKKKPDYLTIRFGKYLGLKYDLSQWKYWALHFGEAYLSEDHSNLGPFCS